MTAVPPQPTDEQIAAAMWSAAVCVMEPDWFDDGNEEPPTERDWGALLVDSERQVWRDAAAPFVAALRDARADAERLRAAMKRWITEHDQRLGEVEEAQEQRREAEAEVARLTGIVQAVEKITHDDGGYTTWDQDAKLGEPPWTDNACREWEKHHGHDPRLKCYPEYGCQLLIDPEDLRAALAGGTDEH